MAGDFDARLQALDDKIETNRLATQEQFRVVNDTLVRHGVMLAKLDERVERVEEGLGRVESEQRAHGDLLRQILDRLPPASE